MGRMKEGQEMLFAVFFTDRPGSSVLRAQHLQAHIDWVAAHQDTAFVQSLPGRRGAWQSATVMASDCMTADVLTKWALQSSLLCPQLKAVMRGHQARMWRS